MYKIENIIKDKDIKLTNARMTLLNILQKAKSPLSYEDIKLDISMDKATFYRNISKFEKEDIVNSFESNDRKRYYELKLNPHSHFVCVSCNKVECLEKLDIKLDGYTVNNIIINGKCKACTIEFLNK